MQWPPVEPSYTGAPQMPPPLHASLPFALEPPFLAPPAGAQQPPPQLLSLSLSLSGHRNERELQLEAAMSEAVRFVSNLLANRVPRRRVQGLGEQLFASLIAHLAVPNRPPRVVIKTGAPVGPDGVQLDYVDQCVRRAIENAGLDVREVVSFLPDSLQLILEENEESLCLWHREGEQGTAKPLFKARYTSSLRVPPAAAALYQQNLLVAPPLPPPPLASAHQPLLSRTISLPGPMSAVSGSGSGGLALPPSSLSPAARSDSGASVSLEPLSFSLPPASASASVSGESLFNPQQQQLQQPPFPPLPPRPALALSLPASSPATLDRLVAIAPHEALALKRSSNGCQLLFNERERAAVGVGGVGNEFSSADDSIVALISSLDLASLADDSEPQSAVSQHEQRAVPIAPLQSEPPFLVKYAPPVACIQSAAVSVSVSDRLPHEAPSAAPVPVPVLKPPAYFCSTTTWQPAQPAVTQPPPQPHTAQANAQAQAQAQAVATFDAWSAPLLSAQASELVQLPTAPQEALLPASGAQQRQLFQETGQMQVPASAILPTLPSRSSCSAVQNEEQSGVGVVYSAAEFAATKFGSTKLRSQPRRPAHMMTRPLVLNNCAGPQQQQQRSAQQAARFPAAVAPAPRPPAPYRKLSSETSSPLARDLYASAPIVAPPPLPARTYRNTGTNSVPQTAYPQQPPQQPSFKSFSNFPSLDAQTLWSSFPIQYEPPPIPERAVTQHNLGPIGSPVPVAPLGSNATISDGADSGIDGPVVMRPRQPPSQEINAEAARGTNNVQQKQQQQQQPQASLVRLAQLDQPAQRSSAPARIGAPSTQGGGPGTAGGGPLACAEQLDWGIGSLPANASNPLFPALAPAASSGTSSLSSDFFPFAPPTAFASHPFNFE